MYKHMYFVILRQIFVLGCQMFKPGSKTISATWFAKGSTQLVQIHQWHNLTTIRAALIMTSLVIPYWSWQSSPTSRLIVWAGLFPPLKLACNSQLFCRSVGLQLPAATSPAPAVTATTTHQHNVNWSRCHSTPPRHCSGPHKCFIVIRNAPSTLLSVAKCSQTVQEQSQVLLQAPAVLEVHSACSEIWLLELSNGGITETSA